MKFLSYLQICLLSSTICFASSSSSNFDTIDPVQECLEDHYNDVSNNFSAIHDLLQTALPNNSLFVVNQVPYTISRPGNYIVIRDLVYNGNGPAIRVTANDVSINFRDNSLTLNNPNAIGILAQNVGGFSLQNNLIKGTSLKTISLVNATNVLLTNLYTQNGTQGINVENCNGVHFFRSQFAASGPLYITGSTHVTVDSCRFNGTNSSYGLKVDGTSADIIVSNSTFTNCLSSIYIAKVDGMLVENCQATSSLTSTQSLLQLGDNTAGNLANDVIVRNSTFTHKGSEAGFDGILITSGSNCLLENLVIDTACIDSTSGPTTAAVHVGVTDTAFQNLLAKNCIIKGANQRAVLIENGKKIAFDECQVSGASDYNFQMVNATSCAVTNCTVFDADTGIYIDNSAGGGNNSVNNCFVYDNTTVGISVNDMAKNNISSNTVWGNGTGIEISFSDYTETFYNTSCNNAQQNCISVYPNQVPGGAAPGTAASAGSNICCDP